MSTSFKDISAARAAEWALGDLPLRAWDKSSSLWARTGAPCWYSMVSTDTLLPERMGGVKPETNWFYFPDACRAVGPLAITVADAIVRKREPIELDFRHDQWYKVKQVKRDGQWHLELTPESGVSVYVVADGIYLEDYDEVVEYLQDKEIIK